MKKEESKKKIKTTTEEQKKLKRSERIIPKMDHDCSEELEQLYKKTDGIFRKLEESEE